MRAPRAAAACAAVLVCVLLLCASTPARAYCQFTDYSTCEETFEGRQLGRESHVDIRVAGVRGGRLEYSLFNVTCPELDPDAAAVNCTLDVMLLDDAQFVSFSLRDVPPHTLAAGSQMGVSRAAQTLVFLETTAYHMVVYNPHDFHVISSYSVKYIAFAGETCWHRLTVPVLVAVGGVVGLMMCIGVISDCIRQRRARKAQQARDEEEVQEVVRHLRAAQRGETYTRVRQDADPDETQAAPDAPSVPLYRRAPGTGRMYPDCRRCNPHDRRVPCCYRPDVTVARYVLQRNVLLWPWFPTNDEKLPFLWRFPIMLASLLFQLLVQTVWSSWFFSVEIVVASEFSSMLQTSAGALFMRILIGAVLTSVFNIVLLVICRLCYKPRGLKSGNRCVVITVFLLRHFVMLVLLTLAVIFFVFSVRLLTIYSCDDLLLDQVTPFLLTLIFHSLFPGIPLIVAIYVVANTFGKEYS